MPLRLARRPLAGALLLAAALPLAGCGHHDTGSDTFTWRSTMPAGSWLRVRDTNGSVRIGPAAGNEVVVVATKHYAGRRPERVETVVVRDGEGATVCALWGGEGTCSAERYVSHSRHGLLDRLLRRRSSVGVDFVVAVPPGVRVDASNVNGRVTVADVADAVTVRNVNGSVTIATRGGPVSARTVNGSVMARLGGLPAGAEVQLRSTNGSVTAFVPAALDAEVDMATTNGSVSAALPLQLARSDRRSMHGTLGVGGRHLELRTVNGRVRLERMD